MLSLNVKVGESITLGSSIIKIGQRSGQSVRLIIDSDERVQVVREGAEAPRTVFVARHKIACGITGEMRAA